MFELAFQFPLGLLLPAEVEYEIMLARLDTDAQVTKAVVENHEPLDECSACEHRVHEGQCVAGIATVCGCDGDDWHPCRVCDPDSSHEDRNCAVQAFADEWGF